MSMLKPRSAWKMIHGYKEQNAMRRPYISIATLVRLVICVGFVAEIASPTLGRLERLEDGLAFALMATAFLGLVGDLLGWRASIELSHHLPKFDAVALALFAFLSLASALTPILPSLQFALVLGGLRGHAFGPRQASRYGYVILAIALPPIVFWSFGEQLNGGRAEHLIVLLVVTALVTLAAGWLSPAPPVPPFVVEASASKYEKLVGAADYAMKLTGSQDAKLIWMDSDRQSWEFRECGANADQTGINIGYAALNKISDLPLMIFDLNQDIFLVIADDGHTVNATSHVPNPELWQQMGMTRGMCLPIGEPDDPIFLVLQSRRRSHWADLIAARWIVCEVRRGLKAHRAAMEVREAAMFRLRNAIAMDMHDSVAQSLAGARMMLAATMSGVQNIQLKRDLESIRKALDDESENVRQLIRQLRDTSDQGPGHDVIEKLESLIALARSRWNVDVQLKESQFRMLVPDWLSFEIQQLIREGISNSVRHGSADQVTVCCNRKRDGIWISIFDNGKGFDVEKQKPRSISERVSDLNGEAFFYSQSGTTQVAIRLPSIEV